MREINGTLYLETTDIIKGGKYSLDINIDTARRYLHNNDIKNVRLNHSYYFTLDALNEFIEHINTTTSRNKARPKKHEKM